MHLTTQVKKYSTDAITANATNSKQENADFFVSICHEIRTPLNTIIGLSTILSHPNCDHEKRIKCAEMLHDSSNLLMGLLDDLLDFSKIDAGMIAIEYVDLDIAKVIQQVVHIIATKASEKGLDLHVQITNELPSQCVGDPLRISQILLNLLSNAVKFTEKGQVSLYVNTTTNGDENDQLCITVADTGIGICEDMLEKIFGKYTQGNSAISREYGGTGLGLSISQNLARLMNGDIAVKSWPGMGSHFIVTLPLQKAPALSAVA